jgi:hypothetical protein
MVFCRSNQAIGYQLMILFMTANRTTAKQRRELKSISKLQVEKAET